MNNGILKTISTKAKHWWNFDQEHKKKDSILKMLSEKTTHWWNLEQQKPLCVSVMGQTGVGKSSLVNALFGSTFKVSSTRPETLEPQIWVEEKNGHKLEFCDLPGLGESHVLDGKYFEIYKAKMLESHIVIWAIHADSRSVTFDRKALEDLVYSAPNVDERRRLINKIVFILTKVDLLIPSPWVLTKIGSEGVFTVHKETEKLLAEKESYFQEAFIAPFGHLLKAQTYRSKNFNIKDDYLDYDQHTVYYRGSMSKIRLEELCKKYPNYQDVFKRLYNNYRVIPCSSQFRFNLDPLMEAIVDKLESHVIGNLENFKPHGASLNKLPFDKVKHFGNIVILNDATKQVHDLSAMDYS